MTDTNTQDQATQAQILISNHNKNRGKPQFFYPCSGIGGSAEYTVQITRYDGEKAKHTINGNPKPCGGPGCDYCRNGVKITYNQRFTVRIVADTRNNGHCQRGRLLRWDVGPELAEIITSAIQDGIDFLRVPFRLIVHRRGDSTRPHYGCSHFIVPEPDPFAVTCSTVTTSAADPDEPVWQAECRPLIETFNALDATRRTTTDLSERLQIVTKMMALMDQATTIKTAHGEPQSDGQLKSEKILRDEHNRLTAEIDAAKN